MNKYTTIRQVEKYLGITIKSGLRPQVDIWIEQMSEYIEQITGRVFIARTAVKKYDGNNKTEISVDEVITLTILKINGITITDYLLYPANETPKTRIKLNNGIFTGGSQNIEITANWGYSVLCPRDIEFVATVLTAGIVNFSHSTGGEIKTEKLADYSVTYKDNKECQDFDRAKEILQNYKKIII